MLELAEISPNDVVYDLGCGDGRILIAAVKAFHAKHAVGYELKTNIYKGALWKIKNENLNREVTVYNEDLMNADLSDASVITLFLTTWGNNQLKPKLFHEAQSGTRIISHVFPFTNWPITKQETYVGHALYLYKIP
jgi:tRNA A58 N-methylase Trm61